MTALGESEVADGSDVLRRHFVAIATADYDDPSYHALPGVTSEVQQLQAWLCDSERLGGRAFRPPAEFAQLSHGPTAEQIRKILRRYLRLWTDGDAAVVFITGHGQVADGSHWLVLRDSDSTDLANTALRTGDFISGLLSSGVQHLLLIIDACFAGGSMADLVRLDRELPPGWLVLPSAMKGEIATTGALSTAITKAVDKLSGGQGEKYGLGTAYFTVDQLLETVREFLGESQRLVPIYGSQVSGPHLCLPNPHFAPPSVVTIQKPRRELALPKRDLETHWMPRARGVIAVDSPGWLFTGRAALMRELIGAAAGQPGITLVTGVAGCGKSAVLARLVTLSDPDFLSAYAERVTPIPADLRPRSEAVDVAVVATGKWPHEILGQLFEALAVPRPQTPSWDATSLTERIDALSAGLAHLESVVTIVVDALDEAYDPLAVARMLSQLSGGQAADRIRLLLGVRSPGGPEDPLPDHGPDPARRLGQALADEVEIMLHARRLRVDEPPWWDQDDVRNYAASVLRNTPGSPYAVPGQEVAAAEIAQVLADRAARSFLVARIAASSLANRTHAIQPSDTAWLAAVDNGVLGVFRDELVRSFPSHHDRERAVILLRAVAFSFGRGLPWEDSWPLVANAVADTYAKYGDADIAWLLASPIGAYLVTDQEDDTTVYRLSHDVLRSTLRERWRELLGAPPDERTFPTSRFTMAGADLPDPNVAAVQARISKRLTTLLSAFIDQNKCPPHYLRRHLVEHAQAGGCLDGEILAPENMPYLDAIRLRPLIKKEPGCQKEKLPDPVLLEAFQHLTHRWEYATPHDKAARQSLWAAALGTPLREAAGPRTYWWTLWAHWPIGEGNIIGRHEETISDVAILNTKDGGALVISGSWSEAAHVSDLVTCRPLDPPLVGHTNWVQGVAGLTLPDGRPIAITGSLDGTVRIWDLTTHQPLGRPFFTGSGVCTVAALTIYNGKRIALAGTSGGYLHAWDLETRRPVFDPISAHSGFVNAVTTAALPDGRSFAVTGSADRTACAWDLTTGRQLYKPLKTDGAVESIAALVIDDRPIAITAAHPGAVRVWNLTTGKPVGQPLTGSGIGDRSRWSWIQSVASLILPDGRPIAVTGSSDGQVRVWDVATGHALSEPLMGHDSIVFAVSAAILPDGSPVAVTGSVDHTVRRWELPAGQVGKRFGASDIRHVEAIATLTLPDGHQIVLTGGSDEDPAVRRWDLTSGQPIGDPLVGHTRRVSAVAAMLLPTGQPIAITGSWDQTIRVWDLSTGQSVGPAITSHDNSVFAVTAMTMPNNRPIALTGSNDATVRVWDLTTYQQIGHPLKGDGAMIQETAALAVADGRIVAVSGSLSKNVQVWEIEPGQNAIGRKLKGHTDNVPAVALLAHPDGRLLAISGSSDATVRVWDLMRERKRQIKKLTGHTGAITAVEAFILSDGRAIAVTGSKDHTIRLWDLATGQVLGIPLPTIDPVTAISYAGESDGQLDLIIAGNGFARVSTPTFAAHRDARTV